jgi:hypothetical protein
MQEVYCSHLNRAGLLKKKKSSTCVCSGENLESNNEIVLITNYYLHIEKP